MQQFAQELLSTFGTAIGEVALQPSTGGVFIVSLYTAQDPTTTSDGPLEIQCHVLWNRKEEGGFPGMLISPAGNDQYHSGRCIS